MRSGVTLFVAMLILALFIFLPANLKAQTVEEENATLRQIIEQQEETLVEFRAEIDELNEDRETSREAAIIKHYEAQVEYYDYEDGLRDHTLRTLWWQTIASYIVLALVIAVTGLGVFLSYKEVMRAIDLGRSDPSTISVEVQRVQLTSSITGVIILVLSLGFLFLFLDRVFELSPVRLGATDTIGVSTNSEENEL